VHKCVRWDGKQKYVFFLRVRVVKNYVHLYNVVLRAQQQQQQQQQQHVFFLTEKRKDIFF